MPTIKDIAHECQVSITTVSNILNGKGNISNKTRERVLQVAKEMNYVPNFMAKNLKQRSTKMIGIITEDLTVFNCPEIVDGINEYLDKKGYTFLLGNLRLFKKYNNKFYTFDEYHTQVEEEFKIMQAKNVEGIIYVGAHCRNIKSIPKNFSIPIAIAYGLTDDTNIPSVIFNDEQAAYDAVVTLINKGHKRIGIITGESHSMHTCERLIGCQRAFFEQKVLYNPDLVQDGNWSRKDAYQACHKLMEQELTAIFAMNDIMAAGVYDYCYEKGLVVGRDLDLIGFDNHQICTAFKPPLSTMELPLHKIGVRVAETLIDILEGEYTQGDDSIVKINCELVKRDSVQGIE